MFKFSMMKDIHTKYKANPCIGKKEVKNVILLSDIW